MSLFAGFRRLSAHNTELKVILLFKLIFTDKFSDFSFFIFTFATIFNHYEVLIQSVKFNIYIFFTLLQTYKRINRTLSTQ